MWVAIAILTAVLFAEAVMVCLIAWRMSRLEEFAMIIAGIVMKGVPDKAIIAYVQSRERHPAGKKRGTSNGSRSQTQPGAQSRGSTTEDGEQAEKRTDQLSSGRSAHMGSRAIDCGEAPGKNGRDIGNEDRCLDHRTISRRH